VWERHALSTDLLKEYFIPQDMTQQLRIDILLLIIMKKRNIDLDILDTAGVETFSSMRELYYNIGEGFMFVFSLTNMQTLETVYNIISAFHKNRDTKNIPMVLVGNKLDLNTKHEVSKDKVLVIANYWNIPYIEASAKTSNISSKIYKSYELLIHQYLINHTK